MPKPPMPPAGFLHLDMRLRQFVEEARRDGRVPQAVDAAVGGEIDLGALARAREADMGEAALFLQPGAAALVERALMRKQAFLPAGQEHGVEFQPLGGMQRHDVDGLLGLVAVAVHHQRDVFEEALQVLELLHRAHQLLQVFQPAGGVGASGPSATSRCSRSRRARSRPARCAASSPSARASARTRPSGRAARWRGFGFSSSVADSAAAASRQRDALLARRGRAASARWRRRGRAWAH